MAAPAARALPVETASVARVLAATCPWCGSGNVYDIALVALLDGGVRDLGSTRVCVCCRTTLSRSDVAE